MTKPDKPNSRSQMYQITLEGKKHYSCAISKVAKIVILRAVYSYSRFFFNVTHSSKSTTSDIVMIDIKHETYNREVIERISLQSSN